MTAALKASMPPCVREIVLQFEREIERKECMIADLNQIAEDNFGLSPDDCFALVRHCRDRNELRAVIEAIERIFS